MMNSSCFVALFFRRVDALHAPVPQSPHGGHRKRPCGAAIKVKLVAFDLDGTLLNTDHQLSAVTLGKLRELHALGVPLAFATGRSGPAVYEHVAALRLDGGPLPCVCYNGGVCFEFPQPCADGADARDRKTILFASPIPLDDAAAVVAYAAAEGLLVQYYVGDDIFVSPRSDAHLDLVRRYGELTGATHAHVDAYPSDLEPAKMLLMTDDPDAVLAKLLRGDVCKGNGLKRLCELRASTPRARAFGDGENDVEFVSFAGVGIAMKNGRDAAEGLPRE
ncbi:phosphatase [Aureococcus anophagefferens]|nr:phosphatase [Aureococcus anophagefferens]